MPAVDITQTSYGQQWLTACVVAGQGTVVELDEDGYIITERCVGAFAIHTQVTMPTTHTIHTQVTMHMHTLLS